MLVRTKVLGFWDKERYASMKKINLILIVALIISLLGNGFQFILWHYETIQQSSANSRDTYFSVHHVKEAQQIAKGAGVNVGILDSSFALSGFPNLFAGGQDFGNNENALNKNQGHGWQMAIVLREIAPECKIYALNISNENENKKVDSIITAIEWAMQNDIDILTLSQGEISSENRERLDAAVNTAVESGIVTTFIHYDNPMNLLPYSTTPYFEGEYNRKPDINVYHYDYNPIRPAQIRAYEKNDTPPESGNNMPYFSYSSMSPVTAGFVAILKSVDGSLSPAEYKQVLINTSYSMDYIGAMEWESGNSPHTVDIYQAALQLQQR